MARSRDRMQKWWRSHSSWKLGSCPQRSVPTGLLSNSPCSPLVCSTPSTCRSIITVLLYTATYESWFWRRITISWWGQGHFSGKRMYSMLVRQWWWDGMYASTLKYVGNCPECAIVTGWSPTVCPLCYCHLHHWSLVMLMTTNKKWFFPCHQLGNWCGVHTASTTEA